MSSTKIKAIKRKFFQHKALNKFASPGCHDFVLVLDHLKPNFNIAKILRTGEIFGCKEVHLVGIPFFNPYPAKGALRHVPCKFQDGFKDSYDSLVNEGYEIFVMDPSAEESLQNIKMPQKSAIVIGHESFGMSFELSDFSSNIKKVKIPQFGRIQSLNASVAASLAMYEYLRQNPNPVRQRPPLNRFVDLAEEEDNSLCL